MIADRDAKQGSHFERVQSLFEEALARPEEERRSFLENSCKNERSVLADVLGMLEEEQRGSSPLDKTLGLTAHELLRTADFSLGQEIGPYRLIRMIGEGGMGFVYLAERIDFGNPVAVKFLKDAWLSPMRRARFLSEQRLLAPLHHPSIAKFYDAGTFGDQMPWFAMEYVEGVPLTEHCRQTQCTLKERLHLFRAVCEAVQYAHDRAVIHRDLKPSNILVKPDGSVRLLDFGIAKQVSDLQDSAEQTVTQFRMLTPAYAAPEQIRGEAVGVFTDVYSLGVILWELLVGRTLFDASRWTPGETGRATLEAEPERPSISSQGEPPFAASKTQWADLDVICSTSIHKEPVRRYRSVEALIRDINHFLRYEPLEARSDSAFYKLSKFLVRNRRPVIAGIAVLALIIGLVTFFLVRLTRARDEALAQAQRSERIKTFMQDLFDSGDQPGPSVDLRAIDLLDRGAKKISDLDKEPRIQSELYFTLGDLYDKLGNFDRAASLVNSSLKIRTAEFGPKSKEVAETLVKFGDVRGEQGKFSEALPAVQKGLAIQTALPGTDDAAIGESQMILGRVWVQSGNYQKGIDVLTEAVRKFSHGNAPSSNLVLALDGLGAAYSSNNEFALAEKTSQKALALGRQIYKPDNPLISEEISNLGSIAFSQERYPEAEKYYREALKGTIAWFGPNHVSVATESTLLGQALFRQHRFQEASFLFKRALEIHESQFGDYHQMVVLDLNALALAAKQAGDLEKAEAYFNRVLAIEDKMNGGTHPSTVAVLISLATLKRDQKQYARAEEVGRKAIATAEHVLPPTHTYYAGALAGLGTTLIREKRYSEAEPYLLKAYAVLSKVGNNSMALLQQTRENLAADERALGKIAEADRYQSELKSASKQ